METEAKLVLLADQMRLEPAEETGTARFANSVAPCGFSPAELQSAASGARDSVNKGAGEPGRDIDRKKNSLGLYDAVGPGGRRMTLLKTLLTSACERDCHYCPFRARRNYRRATFKPEEMAQTFRQMVDARVANGLFLSSGVAGGGVRTQDRLIETAEILRGKLGFKGYLHLKIMPGAERDQVLRAMQLADRVSINLEAPNAERLPALAPHKAFVEELLRPLQWAEEIRTTLPARDGWNGRWPSTVTQFVVGASGESDLEILSTSEYLLRTLRLARTYYSAFSPVPETPLENHPAEDPWRQHRLYQASFLIRDYRFLVEDMPFDAKGDLPRDADPKLAWARVNLREQPIELNRAERDELLRIPGIGPKRAGAIIAARRRGRLRDLRDLERVGVPAERAAPFILLDGSRPPRQLSLW